MALWMRTRLDLQIAVGAGAAANARRLAERALGRWRLVRNGEDRLMADTLIVVTELVENVLKHTEGGGHLSLCLRPGAVLIEVTDTSSLLPVVREVNHRRADGRGVRMIDLVASRWGTRPVPGGKVVWVELSTT
jgi:signal transduction histidine kinase